MPIEIGILHKMRSITSLEGSALMERLRPFEMAPFAGRILDVTKNASAILSTVAKDMPLFTLHNERHSLNVIGWMEDLLGTKGIQSLSPLECAFCILAAYVHDLGMTLDKAESDSLSNTKDYMRFRDQRREECHLIDALIESKQLYRANVIESYLRTEYLRITHSDALGLRLRTRLRAIAPELTYQGFDFRRQLELVAISHNQSPSGCVDSSKKKNFVGMIPLATENISIFVFLDFFFAWQTLWISMQAEHHLSCFNTLA